MVSNPSDPHQVNVETNTPMDFRDQEQNNEIDRRGKSMRQLKEERPENMNNLTLFEKLVIFFSSKA